MSLLRAQRVLSHIAPSSTPNQLTEAKTSSTKKDDDVVIVSALRTPIGRAGRGGLKDTYVEDLLATVLKATIDRTKINPAIVEDIIVGTVLGQGSQRANECRIASFLAGFPDTVPIHTLNRQCSSGLQAIANAAANIKAGFYNVAIAAGVESMSSAKFKWEGSLNPKVFMNKEAKSCLLPMGITSENVAERFQVTRKEQDELAVMSHARAAAAIKAGKFKDECVPVHTKLKDPKTGQEKEIVFSVDDGVREDTTLEGLGKLRAVFKEGGSTTAGNASQVSDGASAVLVMSRAQANKLKLPIMAVFKSFAVTGCDPSIMGIGPAVAIPEAVKKAGLNLSDIDLFEINEAFASQATFSVKKLGLSMDKVNVNGGAIALGHPLGCTGARQTATLLYEMQRRNAKYGVVSMCIGSGMGAAAVYQRDV